MQYALRKTLGVTNKNETKSVETFTLRRHVKKVNLRVVRFERKKKTADTS